MTKNTVESSWAAALSGVLRGHIASRRLQEARRLLTASRSEEARGCVLDTLGVTGSCFLVCVVVSEAQR